MSTPQLFSFQGRVSVGPRNADGSPGPLTYVGDVSQLQVKLSESTDDAYESNTGRRMQIGLMSKQLKCDFSATFKQWSPQGLGLGMWANQLPVAAGTVTGEVLPAGLDVDDQIQLDFPGVSQLALTDSSATPATVNAALYKLLQSGVATANNGVIQIVGDISGLTQPLKAAYSYLQSTSLALFTGAPPVRYWILDGVDTETGDAISVHLFKVRTSPISQLDLINDGYGSLPMSGSVLYDPVNDAAGDLGGFGVIKRTAGTPA